MPRPATTTYSGTTPQTPIRPGGSGASTSASTVPGSKWCRGRNTSSSRPRSHPSPDETGLDAGESVFHLNVEFGRKEHRPIVVNRGPFQEHSDVGDDGAVVDRGAVHHDLHRLAEI